jgi:DNA-binding transcriptional MerR regulator
MANASVAAVEYLKPAELAARYKVAVRTINYWAKIGTITPAFRKGNIHRFIAEEVDRQLGITKPEADRSAGAH